MKPPCGVTLHGTKSDEPMKTKLKLNRLFLNCFRISGWRICRAGPVLAACLFGWLLTAQGDPIVSPYFPMDTNVSVGTTVSFRVVSTSTNPPITYQWLYEGTDVTGATSHILVLSNLTLAHAGGYMAMVSNASGDFTYTRTAILTVDPTFTQVMTGVLVTDTSGGWNGCWIDYDDDGNLDYSAAPGADQLVPTPLFRNEGNGTFRKVTTNAIGSTAVRTWSLVWADYDNDGKVDLFVPNFHSWNDMLFHNNGNGSFTRITTGHPVVDGVDSGVGAWSDYDRDGFLDLFVVTYGSCPGLADMLYRNNGDGSFRKVTAGEAGTLVSDLGVNDIAVWVDVDNDGWPELNRMVGNACMSAWWMYTTNQLYQRGSDGKFYLVDIGEMKKGNVGTTFITWADYDNDGLLDGFVAAQNGAAGLYRNLGGMNFTNVTASAFPIGLTNCMGYWSGDFDNDGWQDLVAYYWASPAIPPAFFRNNGDGTFTRTKLGGPTSGLGWLITGDYDNDGFLDVLMQYGYGTRNSLFRHNGNDNHWLKVKLDGRASNRSGIGAKVRVQATIGGRTFWQMREISGQGIGLDNGLLAHFGLGDATSVTTLRIEWPSGIVQEIPNVAPDQFLTVVECQGYDGDCPSFTGATQDASGLQLTFSEPEAGVRYVIEASSDLLNWTKLKACTSTGGTAQFTDPVAKNRTQRFYRLQVP